MITWIAIKTKVLQRSQHPYKLIIDHLITDEQLPPPHLLEISHLQKKKNKTPKTSARG